MALVVVGAAAQTAPYGNPDVVENPSGPNAQVLLYPGGKYGRIVRNDLLEPGDTSGPIKLRKPGSKPPHKAKVRPPVAGYAPLPVPPSRSSVVKPVAAQPKAPPPTKIAAPEKTPVKAQPSKPAPLRPAPRQNAPIVGIETRVAPARPAPVVPPVHNPVKVARMAPSVGDSIGQKRGTIMFEANASDPRSSSVQNINKLADSLGGALSGKTRVQIQAYAGPKGDRSSDSRRLSLKRALIVRQLLIDGGIPSDRIDVHAMGGAADNGARDRVDVSLKG